MTEFSVWVYEARDLKETEILGKQDPYVEIRSNQQKAYTRTDDNAGKFPVWKEEKRVKAVQPYGALTFSIFNKNIVKDTLIGTASLSLDNVMANGGFVDTNLPVITDGKNRGTLHVSVRCLSYPVTPGYAPPQPGYAPPQSGYAPPPQPGYAPPPQPGYAPPQPGYAPPPQPGYAPPYSGPQPGYAPPPYGCPPPQPGYAAPYGGPQPGMPGVPSKQCKKCGRMVMISAGMKKTYCACGNKVKAKKMKYKHGKWTSSSSSSSSD